MAAARCVMGIGCDVVKIGRVRRLMQAHGDRFVRRVLHPSESVLFAEHRSRSVSSAAQFLAGRWAAKEATRKALSSNSSATETDQLRRLDMRLLCVESSASGKPCLRLEARARELGARLGVQSSHVSISHEPEADIAISMVIVQ